MDNCEEQRILDMINKNKKCCRPCFGPTGPTGATGATGPAGAAGATGPAGTVTPAAAVGNATTVDDIVEDFNALLANLRDAGLLER